MTLEYDCPHCNGTMLIGRETAGQEAVCPACRVILILPTPLWMTKREARSKLFPLGIMFSIEGGLCLFSCVMGLVGIVSLYPQLGANDVVTGVILPLGLCCVAMCLGVLLLAAARAAFRAENRILIAIGFSVGVLMAVCGCWILGFLVFFRPTLFTDQLLLDAIGRPE